MSEKLKGSLGSKRKKFRFLMRKASAGSFSEIHIFKLKDLDD